jgi:3-oxoacyl-(acyl-carrier-protein) synthase
MLCAVCAQHDEFYNNLLAGKSGVTEISTFDASQFTTRFAGEIKVRPPVWLYDQVTSAMALLASNDAVGPVACWQVTSGCEKPVACWQVTSGCEKPLLTFPCTAHLWPAP